MKKPLLKIKAFNYKKKTIEILNRNPTVDISLSPEIAEIKKVAPKTRLITKRGDTISSYNLFANKNDRLLTDTRNYCRK